MFTLELGMSGKIIEENPVFHLLMLEDADLLHVYYIIIMSDTNITK